MSDGDGNSPFLGLPTSAWKRLDPAGIVVVALIAGAFGLIQVGLDTLIAAGTVSLLAVLYFSWRFLDQYIGWKRDQTAQEREALKVISELAVPTVKGEAPGRGKKPSTTSGQKKG